MAVVTSITEHLADLQARVNHAARSADRLPTDVTVVAVSKGHEIGAVTAARTAGLRHFGENYLQEALPKIAAGAAAGHRDLAWHFIGRIQSNKTRAIAENFSWAQTVDSPRIAERLAAQRPFHAEPLQVLIQLLPDGAPDRGGCPAEGVAGLATTIGGLSRLRLRGLMLIPSAGLSPEALAGEYGRARRLFDELRRQGHDVDTLSMGMSDDLDVAIAAGSTMIRIGTALFGPRPIP